jgi:prolipoprotein diacylglyceryltransferase
MAIAFLAANYLFSAEARRRKWDQKHVSRITMIALFGGIAGSKFFSLLEDWQNFIANPIGQIFSPSGLTFYGGFITALLLIILYVRKQHLPLKEVADVLAPIVFLAYGIGRIGCQLAGDGDYGLPTTSPVGMIYANGTVKPTSAFAEHFEKYPDERAFWKYDSLKSIVVRVDDLGQRVTRFDEVTPCHPTPLYEFAAAFIAFVSLSRIRKKRTTQPSYLFALTIVLMGVERLAVEFLRVNPLYAGLSMAQWISIALIGGGFYIMLKNK